MEKILILDSNSLINRAFYALPNFSNRKGQFTGAIFGYMNMLLKLIEKYKPDYVIAAFDVHARLHRKDLYEDYKAGRKPMPEELKSQVEPMKKVLLSMGIPILEVPGDEADDIIGTIAKRYNEKTYIVTGDKDSLQLIDDKNTVLLTRKGVSEIEEFTVEHLKESMNLRPSQIIDLKSLMGDHSDNIPGVAGVGEKTAIELLDKYDTIDGVYEHIDEIKGKLKEKLELNKDMAYLSYKLATINTNVNIDFDLESARLKTPFSQECKDILKELELFKVIERMNFDDQGTVQKNEVEIESIDNVDNLKIILEEANKTKNVGILIGSEIEIATSSSKAYKIEISDNLFGGLFYDDFIQEMKPLFESKDIRKLIFDVKGLKHDLMPYDISLNMPYDDLSLMAYLTDVNRNYKNLGDLLNTYNIESNSKSASMFMLEELILKELKERKCESLYFDMEKPLIEVLFDMEKQGFSVDKEKLQELTKKFKTEISYLQKEIYEIAGEEFNLNSPKQLGVILFERLGLPSIGRTKTGYSTSVDTLNELVDFHPIISLILRYREVEKLRSTYLDGMAPLIDSSGKIHTIFTQTVTSTGRLSSTEPNLQNIPIRKEEGKQIRGLFTASKGNTLVCADYSQVELRLMAAFSGDETMIEAFNEGIDIHTTTASKIFNLPKDLITSDIRRQAKAVNFGIIYGITDFGLSQDMGIPVRKAKEFIENYFKEFPKVHAYMNKLVDDATKTGYALTLYGRRRYIPELTQSNKNIQNFGKRIAMNMPLQGSAADIIKLAMIKVYNALNEQKLKSKLIMQVHDELIVDTDINEVDQVKKILHDSMENVVNLKVKLEAEVGVGFNWLEAK